VTTTDRPSVVKPRTATTQRTTNAVIVYLVILVSMQIFLISVATEAFLTDHESLAWASAVTSVVLAGGSALIARYLRH
jgi:hypothetical protein